MMVLTLELFSHGLAYTIHVLKTRKFIASYEW